MRRGRVDWKVEIEGHVELPGHCVEELLAFKNRGGQPNKAFISFLTTCKQGDTKGLAFRMDIPAFDIFTLLVLPQTEVLPMDATFDSDEGHEDEEEDAVDEADDTGDTEEFEVDEEREVKKKRKLGSQE